MPQHSVTRTPPVHKLLRLCAAITLLAHFGCAFSKPPYVADFNILPPQQHTVAAAPHVRVQPASPDEVEAIIDFPGKGDWELSAKADSAGSLLLAPVMLVFFFPEFLNPHNWHFGEDPKITEALQQFPDLLKTAIALRLSPRRGEGARDLLDVTYVAGVYTIGPAADTVCFVVHARVTLTSGPEVLYQEILRIDPRAYNSDIPQPACSKLPDTILYSADSTLPKMIQTRLPGLPWIKHP